MGPRSIVDELAWLDDLLADAEDIAIELAIGDIASDDDDDDQPDDDDDDG